MAKEDRERYKEGVDFEWVDAKDGKGNVVKDGKGKPVKTRRFFKKSEKEQKPAEKPASTRKAAPASKPAAKTNPKPKPNPARAPGGARPTVGKAGGMPAAKGGKGGGAAAAAGAAAIAAAALASRRNGNSTRTPATAKPVNPSYRGGAAMPEGFQGKYPTGVARGGARMAGGPLRVRGPGGRGILKMPDVLELPRMNKGGLVSKGKK